MLYYYDIYGWLSIDPILGRETELVPPESVGDLKPNFTGHTWVLQKFSPDGYKQQIQQSIKQQIELLENQVTQRRLREAVLGIDNGWLQNINNQISDLRVQL